MLTAHGYRSHLIFLLALSILLIPFCAAQVKAQEIDSGAEVIVSDECSDASIYPISIPTPGSNPDQNIRRRYMPVTLTQLNWHNHATDMIYNKFRFAFARFSFYGRPCPNQLIVGGKNTISYNGTTSNLTRLTAFLPQTGPARSLLWSYVCPWSSTEAGALAGEVIALTMNIAYNDERLMPRQPGYDLEAFTIAQGPFRGRKVGQVLDIANRVLGGSPPNFYGLPNGDALTQILRSINANYEYINANTFFDRGYLLPNRSFGISDPPHAPHVP